MDSSRSVDESEGRSGERGRPTREPTYKHIEVAALPTVVPRSYGLRAGGDDSLFPFPPKRREYRDSFGFVSGRALVVLYTLSERHPIAPARERRVVSLLYSRAKAHKL